MVNGLAVLGWGVGGIEAEAAMLGQPHPDADPRSRRLQADRQAARRRHGHRPGADRHADAAQEGRGRQVRRVLRRRPRRPAARRPRHHRQHGAGIRRDLRLLPGRRRSRIGYLRTTNRGPAAKLVEAYAKKQGMWRSKKSPEPVFTDTLSLDLGDVEPSLAGPKRPQDRVPLDQAAVAVRHQHGEGVRPQGRRQARRRARAPTTTSAMATW